MAIDNPRQPVTFTLIGLLVNRPSASTVDPGVTYSATDGATPTHYRSDGSTWTAIASLGGGGGGGAPTTASYVTTVAEASLTSSSTLSAVILAPDILANRPAANAVATGALFSDTKVLYRSNGTTWDSFSISDALRTGDIGTTVQGWDAELAALAAVVSAADRVPYFTGSGTASVAAFTAAARTLLALTTAASMFDTLAPTTTRGDLIFRGATGNIALAKGTSGQFLKIGANDPSWVSLAQTDLPTTIDVQTFSANGTWTKPSWATVNTVSRVVCIGGGGQGGSGRSGTSATSSGGGGGAAGSIGERVIRTSELGATEVVTIGAGGSGTGAAVGPAATNGNAGTAGGNTTFGAWVTGNGGGGGQGGTTIGGSVGALSLGFPWSPAAAGAGQVTTSTNANATAAAGITTYAPGSGGGGGGGNSATPGQGGTGGTSPKIAGSTAGIAGTTSGQAGGGGGAATETMMRSGGGGGGGAGGTATVNGGAGGPGGNFGGGGGGGGGCVSGSTAVSGAGAVGAGGYCVVLTWGV